VHCQDSHLLTFGRAKCWTTLKLKISRKPFSTDPHSLISNSLPAVPQAPAPDCYYRETPKDHLPHSALPAQRHGERFPKRRTSAPDSRLSGCRRGHG